MNPPDKALVLCITERSKIHALDRTQAGMPVKKGRAATLNYKRHGITALFATLDIRNGKVIGACEPKDRARDFLCFLRCIDADPRPCVWTKTAEPALAKECRALEELQGITGRQPTESEH